MHWLYFEYRQNTAFLESRSVPWETVRQILRNYLHGLIHFCKSMQYVWHAALENSENYVYKNSINFLKIFDSTVQTPFGLSFYAATPTCGIISAESLPASFFLTRFLLETCQLLALPEALLFLVPREAPAPGLSQKPVVQNERLLQRRLLHPLPSQGNSTKASQRWWPRQDEASLSACQSSFVSSRVQQQGCAECAGVAVSSSPWFLVENGTEGLMIFRNTFCDCSHCTEGRVGQNSASGYLHGVSQTQYDFFFMETFPRLSQNKLELFTNPCIPIHVFCGQECFISIMQTLFTQFRRWTKSRQWTTFLAADQHVKLTHTLLLGFTPGLFSQLLCESLILNLSRISRLQVQIPSAFHHLLLVTFSSCGPLIPIAPHFFLQKFPYSLLVPVTTSSILVHFSLRSTFLSPKFKTVMMILIKLLEQLCDILHISQNFEKWDFDELSLLTEGFYFW